ncbi:ATP-dependent DNA helicase PIF5, partial [Frankliniella fusca]
ENNSYTKSKNFHQIQVLYLSQKFLQSTIAKKQKWEQLMLPVALKKRLLTERGLVNGAVGTLVDIVYLPNKKPPHDTPALMICKFDNYKGPYPYLGNDTALKLVPIPAISKSWTSLNDGKCTRVQFPVQIAYAMTIHRCQGLTLFHIDKGETKEVAPGATFVGISRAKSLDGIMLERFS